MKIHNKPLYDALSKVWESERAVPIPGLYKMYPRPTGPEKDRLLQIKEWFRFILLSEAIDPDGPPLACVLATGETVVWRDTEEVPAIDIPDVADGRFQIIRLLKDTVDSPVRYVGQYDVDHLA